MKIKLLLCFRVITLKLEILFFYHALVLQNVFCLVFYVLHGILLCYKFTEEISYFLYSTKYQHISGIDFSVNKCELNKVKKVAAGINYLDTILCSSRMYYHMLILSESWRFNIVVEQHQLFFWLGRMQNQSYFWY